MRILMVHNYYQLLGGEDTSFAVEAELLESYGHHVQRYTMRNDQINDMSAFSLAKATFWNSRIYKDLRRLIVHERPQVVHFQNIFPLISPAAYYAARAEGLPVVQTLRNYRLICPSGVLFRDGKPCEACVGKRISWPGVVHACYRGSRIASGIAAAMVNTHALVGTWTRAIDVFIVCSQFARRKLVQGGLPAEKLVLKPNCLHPCPEPGKGHGGYALFVGNLVPHKGIGTLLAAWERLHGKIPLKIVGDGPLEGQVKQAAEHIPGIEWLGRKSLEDVYTLMGGAAFVVCCSECYETFGRVVIEAFAKGTPVIASRIGAFQELVTPQRNGLLFCPGDPLDLAAQVEWMLTHADALARMRREARAEFEAKYTASTNYQRLMEIYALACARKRNKVEVALL